MTFNPVTGVFSPGVSQISRTFHVQGTTDGPSQSVQTWAPIPEMVIVQTLPAPGVSGNYSVIVWLTASIQGSDITANNQFRISQNGIAGTIYEYRFPTAGISSLIVICQRFGNAGPGGAPLTWQAEWSNGGAGTLTATHTFRTLTALAVGP